MTATMTLTLSRYLRSKHPAPGYRETIEHGKGYLFDFPYPWYDENGAGKQEFERMFCMRYWEEEIGYETIALFKMKLEELLYEKMPYYTGLWKSNLMMNGRDPFETYRHITYGERDSTGSGKRDGTTSDTRKEIVDIGKNIDTDINETVSTNETTHSETEAGESGTSENHVTDTTTGTSSNTRKDTGVSQDINTDAPQTSYSSNDYANNLKQSQHDITITDNGTTSGTLKSDTTGTYNTKKSDSTDGTKNGGSQTTGKHLTNENGNTTSDVTGSTTTGETNSETGHESYKDVQEGYDGMLSDFVMKYRETILNLNEMLLDDCEQLFMGIWRTDGMNYNCLPTGFLQKW